MTRLALLAGAVLAACNGGKTPDDSPVPPPSAAADGGIHIATAASSYSPGGQVAITIHNATDRQFAFNPCTRSLERESGSDWTPVAEPNRVCTMEAWLLGPTESRDATIDLPANLSPGRYRLAIDFGAQDSSATRVRAVSNPFTVQ